MYSSTLHLDFECWTRNVESPRPYDWVQIEYGMHSIDLGAYWVIQVYYNLKSVAIRQVFIPYSYSLSIKLTNSAIF